MNVVEGLGQQPAQQDFVPLPKSSRQLIGIGAPGQARFDVAEVPQIHRGQKRSIQPPDLDLGGAGIQIRGAVASQGQGLLRQKHLEPHNQVAVRSGAQPVQPDQAIGQRVIASRGCFAFVQGEKCPAGSSLAHKAAGVPG